MNSKSPAFQFYPGKWDAHTRHLSDYAYRIYHRLMCWMWLHDPKKCTCPQDHAAIAVLLNEPLDRINAAMAEIQNEHMPLLKERGKKYVMDGLRAEAKKQREWTRKSAKGGRTSRKSHNGKRLKANHPSTTLEPKGVPKGNTLSLSLSLEDERESAGAGEGVWEITNDSPLPDVLAAIRQCRPEFADLQECAMIAEINASPKEGRTGNIQQFLRDAANSMTVTNPIGMLRSYLNHTPKRGMHGDPSSERKAWEGVRDAVANDIWDAREVDDTIGDRQAVRRAMRACRDKYRDAPQHNGKDAVSVGMDLALNNKRATVVAG